MPPSPAVQISIIKAVLSEVFNRMDGLFITEDEIIRSFEIEMGKPLSDELRHLRIDLPEFMRQQYYDDFTIIDDRDMRSYLRRKDYLSHVTTNQRAITGTTGNEESPNGSAPPTSATQQQPANGFGQIHSGPSSATQSRQSSHSTPTPPPVNFQSAPFRSAPAPTTFDAPPGFAQPSNQQRIEDQRMEKLQNQFKDYGLNGVFHPEVLKKEFGDLSELVPDEEENHGTLFNNSAYINGSNINSDFFNLDINQDTYERQSAQSRAEIEELKTHFPPYRPVAYSETDDFLEEGTHGIVESPDSSVYEEFHGQFEANMTNGEASFIAKQDDFPPLSSTISHVESKENQPLLSPEFGGFRSEMRKQSAGPSRAETPIEHDLTNKHMSKHGIPFTLPSHDPGFVPQHSKLFYNILQVSINNSLEVNAYRDEYQQYVEENTTLYQQASSNFNWLTGYHLSPNTEDFMSNNAFIIDVLQLYAKKHPTGMSSRDLVMLEDTLCSVDQPVCLGRSTNIMSVSELIQRKVINLVGHSYRVHEEILSINLWKLPPGLTSNLYRILNAQQVTLIQEVSAYAGILNNSNGDPVMVQDEDIVRQANIFPLVFTISAQAAEQQNVRVARIQLHPKLPRWKVLLDQPFAIRSDVPFHCDCAQCFHGTDTQPIIVPNHE